MWKAVKTLFTFLFKLPIILLIVVIIAVGYMFFGGRSSLRPQVTSYTVTQVVRETPIQLVTNRIITMVHCTMADLPEYEASWKDSLLGSTEAIFITRVEYGYGLDLKEDFSEENVIIGPYYIEIKLPEPKLLYNRPDMNYTFFRRTPLLRALADKFSNVNVEARFREVFQQNMERFAEENGFKPTKQEIIDIIGPYFNRIFADRTDKRIIFK